MNKTFTQTLNKFFTVAVLRMALLAFLCFFSAFAAEASAIAANKGHNNSIAELNIQNNEAKEARLSFLFVNGAVLNETFNSDVYNYTATINNPTNTPVIVGYFTPARMADVSINGVAVAQSGQYSLPVNSGENICKIVVKSPDRTVTKTYTLVITNSPQPVPAVTGLTPASGAVGSLVTITGTELTDATALTIGGKSAIVVSNTGTELVAMVMPGATTGDVTLTTPGGDLSGGSFEVTTTLAPNGRQGGKLASVGYAGCSVALSADGNTAVVGAPIDNNYYGAVMIYTRDANDAWTQQGDRIVVDNPYYGSFLGASVAISADGNTVMAGAYGALSDGIGLVFVFTRDNGVWTQQGNGFVGSNITGFASFGSSVALSADGNTAVIGGRNDDGQKGATWIFTRDNGVWTQQGEKLVGALSDPMDAQGVTVAISADGNTVMVPSAQHNNYTGAVWVYTRNAGIWTEQAMLNGEASFNYFGTSVSLSADGNTALISAQNAKDSYGGVYVYTRNGNAWAPSTSIAGPALYVGFGGSLSLSADGSIVAIGASNYQDRGSVWMYKYDGSTLVQQGAPFMGQGATENATMGGATSLSANGSTLIAGGPADNNQNGAVWIFANKVLGSNAGLANLALSTGALSPVFDADITSYSTSVSNVEAITLTPSLTDAYATAEVSINGNTIGFVDHNSASAPLPLKVGPNTITVKVTSEDGTADKLYEILVTRIPVDLIKSVTISPSATITAIPTLAGYNVTIDGGSPTTVKLTVVLNSSSTKMTINGVPAKSGVRVEGIYVEGAGSDIPIVVTAGGVSQTYTLHIKRNPSKNADLAAIKVSSATLVKTGTDTYTATVTGATLAEVRQMVQAAHAKATITVNGVPLVSGATTPPIALDPNVIAATPIITEITAEDGITKKTYTVNVVRKLSNIADLLSLKVSSATLIKVNADTYTATVTGSALAQVNLKAETKHAGASMMVNGIPLVSGATTPYIGLDPNPFATTPIIIEIVAEDRTTIKYVTVNVVRKLSADATLASLKVSGSTLVKTGSTTYTATLANSLTAQVNLKAEVTNAKATMEVNDVAQASGTTTPYIALQPTGTTYIYIKVTAEDGVTTKTYELKVVNPKPSVIIPLSSRPPAGNDYTADVTPAKTAVNGINPNPALSPNGDGITDYFEVAGIESYADNTVTIVNQGGASVYQTKGYDNKTKVFDGHSSINGALQPAGTYFYVIDYKDKGQIIRKTGYLIIRY